MRKLKFIATLMAKGFSYRDAVIASMFEICCHDYSWLARRSRKTLSYLIDNFRAQHGEEAHKLAHRLYACPNVRISIFQIWKEYGYMPPYSGSQKGNHQAKSDLMFGESGAGKARYLVLPSLPDDQPQQEEEDSSL